MAGALSAQPKDYEGVYILVEKIKRDKNRLDLAKLTKNHKHEPEITGGYIFKKDRLNPGEEGFKSGRGIQFCFEEPKEEEITVPQRRWLTNYVEQVEAALFGPDFLDPSKGYRQFIDVPSFVHYHWIAELSRNLDGYWFSVFLHKDRGGKLVMGPIWDTDAAFGNAGIGWAQESRGWRWDRMKDEFYKWYDRMFQDPDFLQDYIDRWSELRSGVFSDANLEAIVDRVAAIMEPAQARNFRRWPNLNPHSLASRGVGETYREQVDYLKTWLKRRAEWIESQSFPAPTVQSVKEAGGGRVEFTLSGQGGTICFTLDGSDPRLPGGKISPRAMVYKETQTMGRDQVLFARLRSPYELWSSPLVVRGGAMRTATVD